MAAPGVGGTAEAQGPPARRVTAGGDSCACSPRSAPAGPSGDRVNGRVPREQATEKAAEIEAWIDQVDETWNILPLDGRVLRIWAKLMHRRPDELLEDALIAATAIVHHLVVVTRNVRDFKIFGVPTLNPFEAKKR